jgi:hypothetical protein
MQDYLIRLLAALPKRAPDASSLLLYLRDNPDPQLRDLAVATLDQLGGGGGGGGSAGFGDFTSPELAEAQEECAAYSRNVRRRVQTLCQPNRQLVLWIMLGQSLGAAYEASPALPYVTPPDCFMFGQSVHPMVEGNAIWTPIGGSAVLTPLAPTVRDGTSLLNAAQQAALPFRIPGIVGQTHLEGFAAQFRRDWLQYIGQPLGAPDNRWVFAECAVGGKSNAELSPGANPELFNKVRSLIDQVAAFAAAAGWSFMVGGFLHQQGEQDYTSGTPTSVYKPGLWALLTAARSYAASVTGQAGTIPVYLFQTGGQFASDAQQLAVARAQLAVADEMEGVYLALNNGRVPDKDGHLTSNGSHWNGLQGGKVATRTIIHGEDWEPTRPIRWQHRGRTLLGLFHTPVGDLRFGTPYTGRAAAPAASTTARGIRPVDSIGAMPVTEVRPLGQVLGVTLGRNPSGALTAWLGSATNQGAICISDSDETRLNGAYSYIAGFGQTADEDLGPDVVGLSYDGRNFAAADVQLSEAV